METQASAAAKAVGPAAGDAPTRLIASGYTSSVDEPGVHAFDIDFTQRSARLVAEEGGVESPSFVAPAGDRLYAASESAGQGGLAAFGWGDGLPAAALRDLGFGGAAGTCYVLPDPPRKRLYGADYNSGSVSSCALDAEGLPVEPVQLVQHEGHGAGRAKDDPYQGRQASAHVHTLSFVPGTKLVAAVDLGLDLISIYRTDANGRIVDAGHEPALSPWPNDLQLEGPALKGATRAGCAKRTLESMDGAGEGGVRLVRHPSNGEAAAVAKLPLRPAAIVEAPLYSGPRIVAYHPREPVAALICETGCELVLFRISEGGLRWQPFARRSLLASAEPTLIPATEAPRAAHCQFTADGRFLYASTRGTQTMACFELDEQCNLVSRFEGPCGGRTPRHFALSPDDAHLAVANKTSDDVSVFSRCPSTGKLEEAVRIPCAAPSCVVWA